MNGSEFLKPIQPNSGSTIHDGADRKSSERQEKVAELKARLESGTYRADLPTLAQRILESGVLDNA